MVGQLVQQAQHLHQQSPATTPIFKVMKADGIVPCNNLPCSNLRDELGCPTTITLQLEVFNNAE
jgi:hypothetical protein